MKMIALKNPSVHSILRTDVLETHGARATSLLWVLLQKRCGIHPDLTPLYTRSPLLSCDNLNSLQTFARYP